MSKSEGDGRVVLHKRHEFRAATAAVKENIASGSVGFEIKG